MVNHPTPAGTANIYLAGWCHRTQRNVGPTPGIYPNRRTTLVCNFTSGFVKGNHSMHGAWKNSGVKDSAAIKARYWAVVEQLMREIEDRRPGGDWIWWDPSQTST